MKIKKQPTQNTYNRNGTEQKGRKEFETEKADIDCSSGRGGAELAGMPMGGVTIGNANIFVGIPPTSEEFFKFFPNGVGTYLSNSNPNQSERVENNEG